MIRSNALKSARRLRVLGEVRRLQSRNFFRNGGSYKLIDARPSVRPAQSLDPRRSRHWTKSKVYY
jgi:hypothetical protein